MYKESKDIKQLEIFFKEVFSNPADPLDLKRKIPTLKKIFIEDGYNFFTVYAELYNLQRIWQLERKAKRKKDALLRNAKDNAELQEYFSKEFIEEASVNYVAVLSTKEIQSILKANNVFFKSKEVRTVVEERLISLMLEDKKVYNYVREFIKENKYIKEINWKEQKERGE